MENTDKDTKFSISGSFQKGREYLETRFKLLSLRFTAKMSRIIANVLVDITKVIFILFAVFFFSLALGFYLSELLGSNSLGFLATGSIFLIFFLIISALEPKLERFLINASIRKILTKWQNDEEDEQEGKHTSENDLDSRKPQASDSENTENSKDKIV